MTVRRTVGVLGGMGPAATADFLRRIVHATRARSDQDHVRVLVDSDPRVPDRTAFLQGRGADPRPCLVAMAQGLERSGADFLVMPCNTAHAFADEIAAAVAVPFVDWPGVVAADIVDSGVAQVGVLATSGTILAGIYQRSFSRRGAAVLLPPDDAQAALMDAIYGEDGVKAIGPRSVAAAARLASVARALVDAGADGLAIACTELSTMHALAPLDVGVSVFDAAEIVARHVVVLAGGDVNDRAGAGASP